MKTYTNILITVALVSIQACQTRDKAGMNQSANGLAYTVSLEQALGKEPQSVSLSEIGGTISYIPLETNEKSLLKSVESAQIKDSSLFILSDRRRLLLQFDVSGKFVRQIGQQGKGPEDFRMIASYIIGDTSLRICAPDKCLTYNHEGGFVKSLPLNIRFRQVLLKGNDLLINVSSLPVDSSGNILLITDPDFNVLRKFTNNHKRDYSSGVFPIDVLSMYTFQGDIRFKELGVDTLYTVTSDALTPYAVFDLGEQELPSVLNVFNNSQDEIEAQNRGKVLLSQIFEDPKHFYMRFNHFAMRSSEGKPDGGGVVISVSAPVDSYYYGLYAKETGDIWIFDKPGFQNDLDGGLPFFPKYVYNDSILVDWVDALDLREQVLNSDATEMQKLYGQKYDDLVKLAKSLNDDSNPVLVLVRP